MLRSMRFVFKLLGLYGKVRKIYFENSESGVEVREARVTILGVLRIVRLLLSEVRLVWKIVRLALRIMSLVLRIMKQLLRSARLVLRY